MKKLEALKVAKTKPDLAHLLGVKPSFLTYVLYVLKPETQYHSFDIAKRSGGFRTISAPSDSLKSLQSCLSILLQDCMDELIAEEKSENRHFSHTLSHGFERNRSIITNALSHIRKKNILNIDLKDFFGSFNFGRVRGFFIKNRNFLLEPEIATVISQISCYNDKLPQGSPSSPIITNLITHAMDIRLAKIAKKNSCSYSRYADDITISTRKKIFPEKIMRQCGDNYIPGKKFLKEIKKSGFEINSQKTRIIYQDSRQEITGLVSNRKPNVKCDYWRLVRAQCHKLFTTGSFTECVNGVEVEGNINRLEGKLNFIDQLDYFNRLRKEEKLNPHYVQKKGEVRNNIFLSSREKNFGRFLYYRAFFANEMPTIMYEGKTDYIYLLSAIKNLHLHYPLLVRKKEDKYETLVTFFKYTHRTRFFLNLSGGASFLTTFINDLKDNHNHYSDNGFTPKPVIIIMDNDHGFENVPKKLKNIGATIYPSTTKKGEYRLAEFIHIYKNFYLVLTPALSDGKHSAIEDLFDSSTRNRKVRNKTFNPGDKIDKEKEYGKNIFANEVVKPNRNKIDFSGFRPLLDRIAACIDHHEKEKQAHS